MTQRLLELSGISSLRPARRGPTPDCLRTGARVLDVGCGDGGSVDLLNSAGYAADGVDADEQLAEIAASRNPGASILQASAESLPHADSSYDAVMFECSLSLTDSARSLAEARRVLRPGGALMVADVFSGTSGDGGTIPHLVEEDFLKNLAALGYIVTGTEDHTQSLRDYYAQMLMDSGTAAAPCSAAEREAIKRINPRYLLYTAGKPG